MSLTEWPLPDVQVAYCAARVAGDELVGVELHDAVTPASVMKVQVALTALTEIHAGRLDESATVWLDESNRTPGPVGMSLFEDPVRMSVRDLIVMMMTISDNVATDALIDLVGLEAVNATARRLGLTGTLVASSLHQMLDAMATDAGFADYARLADAAGPSAVCARLRRLMAQQLTRHRIASGFGPGFAVAAKSRGLMGIVRNEVGVVTDPDGVAYAVAVFTRRSVASTVDPAQIDTAIGAVAKELVPQLADSSSR